MVELRKTPIRPVGVCQAVRQHVLRVRTPDHRVVAADGYPPQPKARCDARQSQGKEPMTTPPAKAGSVSVRGMAAATWNLACAFPAGPLHSGTPWPATGALIWWAPCSVASPATAGCATDARFGGVHV